MIKSLNFLQVIHAIFTSLVVLSDDGCVQVKLKH